MLARGCGAGKGPDPLAWGCQLSPCLRSSSVLQVSRGARPDRV